MTASFITELPVIQDTPNNSSLLSVSKIKTFADCKAKYKYGYILKLPRKEWEHHVFGSFLHEVLENFYNDFKSNTDTLDSLMTKAWDAAYEAWKEKLTQDHIDEGKLIIAQYLTKIKKQLEENSMPEVTDVEKKFYLNINDRVFINGFIDRVQCDKDKVVHVADYKTTKNKKYLKDDFQLKVYAYALFLENPELDVVRTSYILLRHNIEQKPKEYSRKDLADLENKFMKYADEIEQEQLWRASVSPLCKYCDYLTSCEEGKNYLGMNQKYGKVGW